MCLINQHGHLECYITLDIYWIPYQLSFSHSWLQVTIEAQMFVFCYLFMLGNLMK